MIRSLLVCTLLLTASVGSAQLKLDSGFGSDGVRTVVMDERSSVVQVLAGPNDTVFVLGTTAGLDTTHSVENLDAVVLKFTPTGELVPGFGTNGVARFDFPGFDISNVARMELQPNGQLLIVGSGRSFTNNGYVPFCLSMLNSDGSLDDAVGNSGVVELPFLGAIDVPRALVRDQQNCLLVAGATTDTSQDLRVACVARLLPNLELDTTFGATGLIALDPFNGLQSIDRHISDGVVYDVLVMADNSVLLAGGDDQAMYFVKLTANGTLDLQFGTGGHQLIHYHTDYINRAVRMQLLPDGTVAFGARLEANFWALRDMMLGRINPTNGSYELDGIDFYGHEDVLEDVVLASNDALVSVGRAIRVENASVSSYQSDYVAVGYTSDYEHPQYTETMLFSPDTTVQSGATAIAQQASGRFVVGGFVHTATAGQRNLMLMGLVPQNTSIASAPDAEQGLQLYPNPASQHVWLQPGNRQFVECLLMDATGRVHRTYGQLPADNQLSLAGLPAGLYFVQARDAQGHVASTRLIIR